MRREEFLAASPITRPLLEIGPGVYPLFAGDIVSYFDVFDAEELRTRFAALGQPTGQIPSVIHYVSPTGDLDICPSNFSFVASSHNIEHQPDLVKHLQQASNRLLPGGVYLLIIPDKRYCFDHFIPESTVADVVGAWLEKRMGHSARDLVTHRALTTHNDPVRHWAGDHGEPRGLSWVRYAIAEWRNANGTYLDVHAWQFTPDSFRKIMAELIAMELSSFEIEFVGETPRDRFEFCVRLRKAN